MGRWHVTGKRRNSRMQLKVTFSTEDLLHNPVLGILGGTLTYQADNHCTPTIHLPTITRPCQVAKDERTA